MSNGSTLTDVLVARLAHVTRANGYASELKGVYPFGDRVLDAADKPFVLVRIDTDSGESKAGYSVKRQRVYELEFQFPRTARLSELEQMHFDVMRALSVGLVAASREFPGEILSDEYTTIPAGTDGSTVAKLISSITVRYVEQYKPS